MQKDSNENSDEGLKKDTKENTTNRLELEENKEKIDNIVETLINQGVFNEDELNDSRILDKKQNYLQTE